jgi:hypothetical protein
MLHATDLTILEVGHLDFLGMIPLRLDWLPCSQIQCGHPPLHYSSDAPEVLGSSNSFFSAK